MNISVLVACAALLPIGFALVYLFRTLSLQPDPTAALAQCLLLSIEKYRPMERLLREDDLRFLSGQPGFSPSLGRRFRRERRRIFRGYLGNLRRDFSRVSVALQTLLVHSADDRGDLASALIRQRVFFALGMLAIEVRLLLHAAGFGTIDVRNLVESLQTMQAQVQLILTPPQTAAVSV